MNNNRYLLPLTIAVIIVIVGLTAYFGFSLVRKPKFEMVTVAPTTITQGLATTGTVTAASDLSLSFAGQGTISNIAVSAGSTVKQGQVLLSLNNSSAAAAVAVAEASVETAQANYEKLLNGATSEQVSVTQTSLSDAQKNLTAVTAQQNVLVTNALRTLMNSSLSAVPGVGNIDSTSPTISGSYSGTEQGSYSITLFPTGGGTKFVYSGLESGTGSVSTEPQPLGQDGLFIAFPSTSLSPNDTWTISLPNTQGTTYVTNYNAYQLALQTQTAAVQTAQTAVDSAQAQLNLQQTTARPEDVASAKAAVDAARAQLQSASTVYSNDLIVAPSDGTVTDVEAKIGEVAAPGQVVLDMISDQNYEVDTFISESQLNQIKLNDPAQITLDAYGVGTVFDATIVAIDPAATVQDGQQSYKVTLQFTQNDDRIKEGMGANITVTDQQKANVLTVPGADVFSDGINQFVLLESAGKTVRQPITTGLVGVDGSVEVLSGLSAGQQIASLGK